MTDNAWPKRFYTLDVSRGIAALAVVLWHWQHFAYKDDYLPSEFTRDIQPLYGFLRLFYEKGEIAVQYFFLLSGFIFFWLYSEPVKNKTINAREFGIHRFSRLYPLHFITLILVAILQFFYISLENTSFVYQFNDMFHFFLNLGFASNWGFESGWSFNAPAWSISIEVLLYFIFFLTTSFGQDGWLFCLSASAFSFLVTFIPHPVLDGLSMFFLGGLVFHLTKMVSGENKNFIVPVYCLALFSWFCVIVNYYLFDLGNSILMLGKFGEIFLNNFPFFILFPTTVMSLALIEIAKGPLLKSISWIGDITYSAYLLHFPLQLLFGIAVSLGILDYGFHLHSAYLAVYFMILIPASYIAYISFEKPMQRIIRNKLLPGDRL